MGKNKKKKAQMFSNFLAFKAGHGNQNAGNRPNVVIVNKPILPTLLGQSQPPPQFQTPHGEQDKLTELLDDNSPGAQRSSPAPSASKWKPVEDVSSIQVNIRKVDPKRPNLTIVEGSAARIQLALNKSEPGAAHEVWVKVKSQEEFPSGVKKSPPKSTPETRAPPAAGPRPSAPPAAAGPRPSAPPAAAGPRPSAPPAAAGPRPSAPPAAAGPRPSAPPAAAGPRPSAPPAAAGPRPSAPPAAGPRPSAPPAAGPRPSAARPPPPSEGPPAAAARGKRRPQWVLAAPAPAKRPASAPAPAPAPLHNAGSGWPRSMSSAPEPPAPATPAPPDPADEPQPYSPSDVYSEATLHEEGEEAGAGGRRLSAFQRLGPAAGGSAAGGAEALRELLAASAHELVVKYREQWPHRTPIVPIRVASVRASKSAMLLQTEYMEETYQRDNRFVLVTVTGFPENWSKEDVLDAILESVKGKSFIPCFIEMSGAECRFLVVRCRAALLHVHKYGFVVRGAAGAGARGAAVAAELVVALGAIQLTLAQLDFVPRLALRRLVQLRLRGARLDLSRFTLEPDVSHLVYFPLWRACNQAELVQLPGAAPWAQLTHLDLSHNGLTTLSGLELGATCPRLRALDLGHNRLASAGALLGARAAPLASLVLEGNPLCHDHIHADRYLAVLTLLFPTLLSVDGVPVHRRGSLPPAARRYSESQSGASLAERVLSALLALLARPDASAAQLYRERATLRVTVGPRLRHSDAFASGAGRALFRSGALSGRAEIARALQRWPPLQHDPAALTLDVLHHSESATLLAAGGLARAAGATDAVAWTRSLLVRAGAGGGAVLSEMLHWDAPARALLDAQPLPEQIKPIPFPLSLDDPPDADLKQQLLAVFMQITELDKKPSERCLAAKDWNLKNALEYFVTMLKLDRLEPIMKD